MKRVTGTTIVLALAAIMMAMGNYSKVFHETYKIWLKDTHEHPIELARLEGKSAPSAEYDLHADGSTATD